MHGCKQHIRKKPISFGYKLWLVCSPSGYLIQFIPYHESKASQLPLQHMYGLGGAAIKQLLSILPQNKT